MKKETDPNKQLFDMWHNDPDNWKLGLFYFNPKDKRIFPPKKFAGLGWTINFANPYSVFAFLLLLLLVIVVTRLIRTAY